ncbi:MAG: sigma-54 dependent transcriptional regulator [Candidatus Acidiferrales bacterium]
MSHTHLLYGLIGESAPMRQLFKLIGKISQSAAPVLLLGETGTGKELVARAIHFSGLRRKNVFVPVDCSALAPTLIEAELFGYVKGAFTGGDQPNRGLLQSADGGTVFLDEIGEIPIFLQAKLLRALQEKEIRPVGSTQRVPIDVRIIAATHRNLQAGIRDGTFRQDLYFRLNVLQIVLPPLRDRKGDIPLLVAYFLKKFSEPHQPVHQISSDALRHMIDYDWPGNVRELENAVECAVALASENVLTTDDLASVPICAPGLDITALMPIAELERRAILRAIHQTRGDKVAAARLLGMGKTTLYRKLMQYARFPNEPAGEAERPS